MPNVTRIQRKDFISDLDEIAREGARRMLAEALENEQFPLEQMAQSSLRRWLDRSSGGKIKAAAQGLVRSIRTGRPVETPPGRLLDFASAAAATGLPEGH